jgi:hypothetical protein
MMASHSCWQPALDPSPAPMLNFPNVPPRLCSPYICNIPPVRPSVSAYSLCYGCRATTLSSTLQQFFHTISDDVVREATIDEEHRTYHPGVRSQIFSVSLHRGLLQKNGTGGKCHNIVSVRHRGQLRLLRTHITAGDAVQILTV